MTLRGAPVEVDVRRLSRVLVGVCLGALAASAVALAVAGAHRNAQITRLHQDGVRVEAKVSGCMGLLGGSGSNAAGYQCRGTFTLDGHSYNEAIPGMTFHAPGSRLGVVAVPGDPALMAPVGAVAGEHASWRVFVLPAALSAVFGLFVGGLLLRSRRARGSRLHDQLLAARMAAR